MSTSIGNRYLHDVLSFFPLLFRTVCKVQGEQMVAKLGQGATYISGAAADASFLLPTCRSKQATLLPGCRFQDAATLGCPFLGSVTRSHCRLKCENSYDHAIMTKGNLLQTIGAIPIIDNVNIVILSIRGVEYLCSVL